MNTIISPSDSYTVGAKVDGQDLENGAVVAYGASFRAVYAPQSPNDPDVVSFKVSLQNSAGSDASSSIVYAERGAVSDADESSTVLTEVGHLTDSLPTFSLPSDLPPGRYTLVLQVMGKDGVLYESAKTFFYIADELFSFSSLASYPPGTAPSSGAPVFPIGMPLLLQAAVSAGDDLDPYLVWYADGKRISEGRVSSGTARLLWTPPKTAGFHRVDVSLFPSPPKAADTDFVGLSRTLTVAVSSSAEYPGLGGAASAYSLIFRLLASLSATDSLGNAYELSSSSEPSWDPFSDGYGLLIGGSRVYRCAYPPAKVQDGAILRSSVSIRAAPSAAGVLFRGVLSSSSTEGLAVTLSSTASGFVLAASSGGTARTAAVDLGSAWTGDAHVAKIEFGADDTSAYASSDGTSLPVQLILDGSLAASVEVGVPDGLTGAGYFVVGESAVSSSDSSSAEGAVSSTAFAVLDDIAFSLSPSSASSSE